MNDTEVRGRGLSLKLEALRSYNKVEVDVI